jgi:hypothetical protein
MIEYINQTLVTLTHHHSNLDAASDEANAIHKDIKQLTEMITPLYKADVEEQLRLLEPSDKVE